MAWEYVAPPQTVALNAPIIFNDSVPCTCGRVYHDEGNGTFQLNGSRPCREPRPACCCGVDLAEFQVTFTGNIAVPEGGTVGPIAVALALGGEQVASSRAIYTPTETAAYMGVTATKIVKFPRRCCPSLSVEYVNGSVDDPAFVPTPVISVVDGNVTITPVNE